MNFPAETQGANDYEPHPFEQSGRYDANNRELCQLCDQLGGHRTHMQEGSWS